jgi:hypothetical protein
LKAQSAMRKVSGNEAGWVMPAMLTASRARIKTTKRAGGPRVGQSC